MTQELDTRPCSSLSNELLGPIQPQTGTLSADNVSSRRTGTRKTKMVKYNVVELDHIAKRVIICVAGEETAATLKFTANLSFVNY